MWNLSFEGLSHHSDVRSVSTIDVNGQEASFASASRDTFVKVWKKSEGINDYKVTSDLSGHSHFAGCVSARASLESGLIIASGGNDKSVRIWELNPRDVEHKVVPAGVTIQGHEGTVCAITIARDGSIITGSWDNTARVHKKSASGYTSTVLKGHEQAVWAVIELPDGRIVTGSADRSIKIWSQGKCVSTVIGAHDDAVRGLCFARTAYGEVVASCGNDNLVKLWSVGSNTLEPIATFIGHTAFVYSVCWNEKDQTFCSSAEDGTARVWRDGKCESVLDHPNTVWSVCALSNGDIVTGSSDGAVRVWTKDDARKASDQALASYQASLEAAAAAKLEAKREKLKKLPGPEVLREPGRKEGQSIVVRMKPDLAEAYTWSGGKWNLVGEVVDPPDAAGPGLGKKTLYGKEYDFVFDVDMGEGAGMRQIGYNYGQNPYIAAQEFIDREGIDQDFLQQIAQFIEKNVPAGAMDPRGGADEAVFGDPLTGGSRYIPRGGGGGAYGNGGSGSASNPVLSAASDPFTGGGRYVPGGGGGSTGGGGAQGAAVPPSLANVVPTAPITFETVKISAVISKIVEFGATSSPALTAADQETLKRIGSFVEVRAAQQLSGAYSAPDHELMGRLLSWPADKLFPVLDLLRCCVLDRIFSNAYVGSGLARRVLSLCGAGSPTPTVLMALRVVCNSFSNPALHAELVNDAGVILDFVSSSLTSSSIATRLTIATILLNLSLCKSSPSQSEEIAARSLSSLTGLAEHETDLEVASRVSQALASLVSEVNGKPKPASLQLAKDLGVPAAMIALDKKFNHAPEVNLKYFVRIFAAIP